MAAREDENGGLRPEHCERLVLQHAWDRTDLPRSPEHPSPQWPSAIGLVQRTHDSPSPSREQIFKCVGAGKPRALYLCAWPQRSRAAPKRQTAERLPRQLCMNSFGPTEDAMSVF